MPGLIAGAGASPDAGSRGSALSCLAKPQPVEGPPSRSSSVASGALASLREAWWFYRRPPDLLEPPRAPAGRLVVAIAVRVLLIVVLVVVLGHPKWLRRKDLGGYFFLETARCLQRLFARLGGPVLLRVVSEDGGVVGATLVTELAIRVERIDVAPKPVDELSIADLGGIEGDLHRLVVARGLGGDLLIGRPLDRAAGIS